MWQRPRACAPLTAPRSRGRRSPCGRRWRAGATAPSLASGSRPSGVQNASSASSRPGRHGIVGPCISWIAVPPHPASTGLLYEIHGNWALIRLEEVARGLQPGVRAVVTLGLEAHGGTVGAAGLGQGVVPGPGQWDLAGWERRLTFPRHARPGAPAQARSCRRRSHPAPPGASRWHRRLSGSRRAWAQWRRPCRRCPRLSRP